MKYRITHPDEFNWCIEEWQEGGKEIEKGKFQGEFTKAKWKPSNAFYPTLKDALTALINKAAGDALITKEANNILEAIKIAESKVLNTMLPENK